MQRHLYNLSPEYDKLINETVIDYSLQWEVFLQSRVDKVRSYFGGQAVAEVIELQQPTDIPEDMPSTDTAVAPAV